MSIACYGGQELGSSYFLVMPVSQNLLLVAVDIVIHSLRKNMDGWVLLVV